MVGLMDKIKVHCIHMWNWVHLPCLWITGQPGLLWGLRSRKCLWLSGQANASTLTSVTKAGFVLVDSVWMERAFFLHSSGLLHCLYFPQGPCSQLIIPSHGACFHWLTTQDLLWFNFSFLHSFKSQPKSLIPYRNPTWSIPFIHCSRIFKARGH